MKALEKCIYDAHRIMQHIGFQYCILEITHEGCYRWKIKFKNINGLELFPTPDGFMAAYLSIFGEGRNWKEALNNLYIHIHEHLDRLHDCSGFLEHICCVKKED